MALDDDGSEAIGIDELEEPLIGLGFADTRDDVQDMIDDVDDDGSGQIEFAEFLLIIKGSEGSKNEKSEKINQFFKDMSQGKIGSHNRKKSLPSFNQIVMEIRRKKMVEFFIDPEKEEEIIQKSTGLEDDGKEAEPKKILVC